MKESSRIASERAETRLWFDQHLPELMSRCHAYFHFLPAVEREEAAAETLASVTQYVIRASKRGKLNRLTPFTLIVYFGRLNRSGRRMTGAKTTDAMSEAARRRGHHRVHSLADTVPISTNRGKKVLPLWQILSDRREDSPPENVRRSLDYADILARERVGPKVRRVFDFLCQSHGTGCQKELAAELRLSPGRITQLKGELAGALARHGYGPPPTRAGCASAAPESGTNKP